jgi:hypothetical protein
MKVKLFQEVIGLSRGQGDGKEFGGIEKQINEFLASNPKIHVIDVKLTSHAAPVSDIVTNYALMALLLYNE